MNTDKRRALFSETGVPPAPKHGKAGRPLYRMLKKATSGVLGRSASSRTCMYAPGASLPAALLDGLFEHPVVFLVGSMSMVMARSNQLKRVLPQPLSPDSEEVAW